MNPAKILKNALIPLTVTATAAFAHAETNDKDRVMSFLYQNASSQAVAAFERSTTATSAEYAMQHQNAQATQHTETSSAHHSSYEQELNRLKKVAHGSGEYRTPQKTAYDTLSDIKSYIQANTSANMNCWALAAKRYDLNPYLLYSIALVESGMKPGVTSKPNYDGTRDIGLMQVNSTWIKTAKFRTAGISTGDLKDPCVNIHVGAWVLKSNINALGYTWQAIGSYNAWKNKTAQHRYATKVYAMYGFVIESRNSGELFRDPMAPLRKFNEWQRKKRA